MGEWEKRRGGGRVSSVVHVPSGHDRFTGPASETAQLRAEVRTNARTHGPLPRGAEVPRIMSAKQQRLDRLKARASAGDVPSQCRLAEHWMAVGTTAGYRDALPWLRRAASVNDSWAQYILGWVYHRGAAGRRDLRQAALWYERASAQGDPSARLNLGILVANRRGSARDLPRAMQLYRLAARQGRRNAMYNLGLYHALGRGVPRNLMIARRWFGRAADLGDRDARRIVRELGALRGAGAKASSAVLRQILRLD